MTNMGFLLEYIMSRILEREVLLRWHILRKISISFKHLFNVVMLKIWTMGYYSTQS